jgi:Ca-activated chloride channel family protein
VQTWEAFRSRKKRLTPRGLSCGRISVNEVFVGRHHRHGCSRRLTANRDVHVDPSGDDVRKGRRTLFLSAVLAAASSIICYLAPIALAQTPIDDVHIAPRVELPKSSPNELIDPSLKTHTKPLKAEVNLVLVPVTITDPLNRLVTGLDKENFQLFEGKDAQEIRHFSSEDAPVSIGVIFDMSGSMASKIERAREAVIEFFKTANPQDEFFMVAFADKPQEISDFTSSVEDIQGKLVYTVPKGWTRFIWASAKCGRQSIKRKPC